MSYQQDPAIALVAKARKSEAAFCAALSAGHTVADDADDDIFDALAVIPTTVEGLRAKVEMALDIEATNWPDDAITLLRSLLPSPVLAPPA